MIGFSLCICILLLKCLLSTKLKPIEGNGVSRVVDSNNPDFKAGDLVSGLTNWEEYSVIKNTGQLKKLQKDDDIPLSYYLGLLGASSFTFPLI